MKRDEVIEIIETVPDEVPFSLIHSEIDSPMNGNRSNLSPVFQHLNISSIHV
jgi:hypothetical protein